MKKILIISPINFFPPYWGAAARNYHLTKILTKNNKIWLICNDDTQLKRKNFECDELNELTANSNIQIHFIKCMGRGSQLFNYFVFKKALKIIQKEKIDVIIAYSLFSGIQSALLGFLKKLPYILDQHNVEFLKYERMKWGNKVTRFFIKKLEKFCCNFATKIICVSEVDRNFFITKLGINERKVVIVPNGIDIEKFHPDRKKINDIKEEFHLEEQPIILYFGTFDYLPNYEAVKIIRNELLPKILKKIPEAKFLIVGNNPPLEFKHENIIFTGVVEKIEDFINASNVVICPLISGSGTRFKILEALACGKNVVSTSIGAEGLVLDGFNEIKICDDWDEFSNATVSLLSEKSFPIRQDLINKYSWEKNSPTIENILKHLDKS